MYVIIHGHSVPSSVDLAAVSPMTVSWRPAHPLSACPSQPGVAGLAGEGNRSIIEVSHWVEPYFGCRDNAQYPVWFTGVDGVLNRSSR